MNDILSGIFFCDGREVSNRNGLAVTLVDIGKQLVGYQVFLGLASRSSEI
jgi:hypothetical protein